MSRFWSVARTIIRGLPNLLRGYSIYTRADKLSLINHTFTHLYPIARSFADLGGVWNVNGSYSRYTLSKFPTLRGFIVDTDYPDGLDRKLSRYPKLEVLRGDFTSDVVRQRIGAVDVVYLFDVLLHQAQPNWDEVLTMYSTTAPCVVIYNQQYNLGYDTIRLTELPMDQYMRIAPRGREDVYRFVYEHRDEIHPEYGKPWKDVHNIFQWGITDRDLRRVMTGLGYREVFYRNYGPFSGSPAFENHGFVFVRNK